MLASAVILTSPTAATVLTAAATDDVRVYAPIAGSAVVATLVVVMWLMGKIHPDSAMRRVLAERDAERETHKVALAEERADRKEAQNAVNAWLPLMTRAVTVMETITPLLQTEVHIRHEHHPHPGDD